VPLVTGDETLDELRLKRLELDVSVQALEVRTRSTDVRGGLGRLRVRKAVGLPDAPHHNCLHALTRPCGGCADRKKTRPSQPLI
jgi:hypothetical protein